MKDRTDRLFEAIENPDSFSDDEIKEILDDTDVQELYKQICKTADALTSTEEPDIDREWEQFVSGQKKSVTQGSLHSLLVFFNRNAAAVFLCAVASLAVVAATLGVSYSFSHSKVNTEFKQEIAEPAVRSDKDLECVGKSTLDEPEIVIFKDVSFRNMISAIADFYGVSVVYKTEKPKELRMYFQWDRGLPLNEIVEQLNNFEQIKIGIADNTMTIE